MVRFGSGIGILMLAGSFASACFSVDDRRVVDGEPSEGMEVVGNTPAEPQPMSSGAPGSANGTTSRESTEGNNVVGLAGSDEVMVRNGAGSGEGAGGSSMAGVGGGAGGSSAGVEAAAGGSSMPGAAGGPPMPMAAEAPPAGPNVGSNGGTSGSPDTSGGGTEGGTDVGVIANSLDRFFRDWPAGADPLAVGTRAAEIFTSQSLASGSGHANDDDYKHYKDACAWYGSLAIAELGGQQSLINALVAKYLPYEGTWGAFDPPTAQ